MADTKKLLTEFSNNLVAIHEVETNISKLVKAEQVKLKELQKKDTDMCAAAMDAMEKNDVKKFENEHVVITYVAPSKRMGVDVAKLKDEEPDTYKKFLKISPIKASIRIKVKEDV